MSNNHEPLAPPSKVSETDSDGPGRSPSKGPGSRKTLLARQGFLGLALLVLGLTPGLATVAFVPRLPEQVPLHWGADGQIDRWGSKWEIVGMAVFCLVFSVVWLIAVRYVGRAAERSGDEPRSNVRLFLRLGLISQLMFNAITLGVIYVDWSATAAEPPALSLDFPRMACGCLGVCMILVGDIMPQVKPNRFIGARMPGAYASRDAWRRVQRACGWCFIALGAATLLAAVAQGAALGWVVLLSGMVATSVFMLAYSAQAGKKHGSDGTSTRR
ncbi:putative membrane protein [Bifidobacterium actinocoloniiforme DSM 22766]|uniref:Putative membrane protein n=1 Tax=Bifidobacterium actinocoloniiforme DSM 22766 TaxID=1437605 RepID=A0A086Z095_9BIFI|nr:DUF1648 domain-containing protein [Bifidobacterium actinocoloniiforme]AKV55199.1 hypothetical protein AB656_01840 [Bifidobacterium actinocoloniiforme DSM 22766]KFI39945.1 putative membrane protein [Bifidobacterium actinocoloniiforme DSM 22766]